jgi:NADH-quinone oxidoreductase subunit N
LLGYSAIAHAGYMILGVLVTGYSARGQQALAPLLYYAATYALTTVGAFGVVMLVENKTGNYHLTSFAGLSKTAPFLSFCMMVFMLSLAGIPPLAGFFGKFLLFKAAIARGASDPAYYWLVAIAIVGVIISMYYYFGVVRVMYWGKEPTRAPIHTSTPIRLCLVACVAGMLALGLFPNWLVNVTTEAVKVLRN